MVRCSLLELLNDSRQYSAGGAVDRVLGIVPRCGQASNAGVRKCNNIEDPFIAKYDRRSFSVWSQGLEKSQTLRQEQRHAEERKIDIVLEDS